MSQNDQPDRSNPFDEYIPLDTAPLPDIDLEQMMNGHIWKQEGNLLHCDSCVNPHGMVLHGHEKLSHQEGSMPIIKKMF